MLETLERFLHMGGYGFYVWTSYGVAAAVLVLNVWWPIRASREIKTRLGRQKRFEETDRHDP